jgi:hypothetical protein
LTRIAFTLARVDDSNPKKPEDQSNSGCTPNQVDNVTNRGAIMKIRRSIMIARSLMRSLACDALKFLLGRMR